MVYGGSKESLQRMNIVCATSVSLAQEAFASLGSLRLCPETEIDAACLRDADAVVTRSKTALVPALFAGTPVRFAGTCTAGIDHADPEGLAAAGIRFASAPGCNANAVSEYVVASLLEAFAANGFRFAGKTVGIVGHGNVGTRVEHKLRALGMRVLKNDPPKALARDAEGYVPLQDVLEACDVLTLHVPLVEDGPFPTRGLIGEAELLRLRPGALLINACRGEVLDGPAAARLRHNGHLSWLNLDVWDPEPKLPEAVLAATDLASAHIAGHSVEGKVHGTRQVFDALCAWAGIDAAWDPTPLLPAPWQESVRLPDGDFETRLRHAVRACYEIRQDDRFLRAACADRGKLFQSLRRDYRDRREFSATRVLGLTPEEAPIYRALGFR
jgi:erythronate-4-phosphate dehydrogenase